MKGKQKTTNIATAKIGSTNSELRARKKTELSKDNATLEKIKLYLTVVSHHGTSRPEGFRHPRCVYTINK